LITYCAVTISAQLLVMPFVIFYFHKFSVISLFANLIIVPLIGLIVSSGMVMLFIFFLPKLIIGAIAHLILGLTNIVFLINYYLGNLTFSYIYINNFTITNIIFYYIIIILFFIRLNFRKKYYYATLAILLIFTIFYDFQPNYSFQIDLFQKENSYIWLGQYKHNNEIKLLYADAPHNIEKLSQHLVAMLKYYNINKIDYLVLSEVNLKTIKFVQNLQNNKLYINKILVPNINQTINENNFIRITDEKRLKLGNQLFILKFDGNKLRLHNKILEQKIYDDYKKQKLVYKNILL